MKRADPGAVRFRLIVMGASTTVTVIGAGVSGLSCATLLQEAGFDVRIVAERRTPDTTSDVAAAIFYPLSIEPSNERVLRWCEASLRRFARLAEEPDTGVAWIDFDEYLVEKEDDPWWAALGLEWSALGTGEVPGGYGGGWRVRLPRADMPVYLAFLEQQFAGAGGTIEQRRVASLDDVGAPLVVDCAGLGARELCGDDDLHPIRGQVVRVPWDDELRAALAHRGLLDGVGPNALAYVVPRAHCVVLGGTHQPGDESLDPDPGETRAIVARCAAVAPQLAGVTGTVHVGLRPGRSRVRLERERHGEGTVIHDYGHGPLGVTLSWGCAEEVVALAR